jgi:hypothetical protein
MRLNDALKELFLVDQQVRGLESRLDGARRGVRSQQIKIEQRTEQREQLIAQLKQAQAAAANAENEVASIEQKIERLRQQMNTAKTNKEYSAFLVEVNTLKVEKGKAEEQALEHMTRIDSLKEEIAEVEQKLAEEQRIKQLTDRELADRQAEVADQLAELKQQREQAASNLPADALAVFERLAENMDGEAMAPVIETDRRRLEYSCGGCYMSIPVEKVNILATQDKLVPCPSCNRLLYLEAALKEAMGVKS